MKTSLGYYWFGSLVWATHVLFQMTGLPPLLPQACGHNVSRISGSEISTFCLLSSIHQEPKGKPPRGAVSEGAAQSSACQWYPILFPSWNSSQGSYFYLLFRCSKIKFPIFLPSLNSFREPRPPSHRQIRLAKLIFPVRELQLPRVLALSFHVGKGRHSWLRSEPSSQEWPW